MIGRSPAKCDSTNVLIIDDMSRFHSNPVRNREIAGIRRQGGRVLLEHPKSLLPKLYPKEIKSYAGREGEIVTMHVPESPVFDGIEPLDMAWFERGGRRVPIACSGVYRIAAGAAHTTALASQCDIHGYLQKPSDLEKYLGAPLVEIRDGKGLLLASELCYEAGTNDPIAMRLLRNAVNYLEQQK